MIIPRHHRMRLNRIGQRHWFWQRIPDWAFGERYKFGNGDIAYLNAGEIITIRRKTRVLWSKKGEW